MGSIGEAVPTAGLRQRQRLAALRKIATIESVGSSTRIEGVRLCDGSIKSRSQLVVFYWDLGLKIGSSLGTFQFRNIAFSN